MLQLRDGSPCSCSPHRRSPLRDPPALEFAIPLELEIGARRELADQLRDQLHRTRQLDGSGVRAHDSRSPVAATPEQECMPSCRIYRVLVQLSGGEFHARLSRILGRHSGRSRVSRCNAIWVEHGSRRGSARISRGTNFSSTNFTPATNLSNHYTSVGLTPSASTSSDPARTASRSSPTRRLESGRRRRYVDTADPSFNATPPSRSASHTAGDYRRIRPACRRKCRANRFDLRMIRPWQAEAHRLLHRIGPKPLARVPAGSEYRSRRYSAALESDARRSASRLARSCSRSSTVNSNSRSTLPSTRSMQSHLPGWSPRNGWPLPVDIPK